MPMQEPLLSIVIPTKDPRSEVLRRCVAAAQAAGQPGSVEILIVDSTEGTRVRDELANVGRVSYVSSLPPRGVYNAYNAGVSLARGKYVLFLGYDDIVLPGLDELLKSEDLACDRYDVILGRVLVEGRGVVAPRKPFFSLIFRNWPHQGMLYRRAIFQNLRYDERYRIQADHALNIQLARSRLQFKFSPLLVCYFAAGGLSSQAIDWQFRDAMPALIAHHFGPVWGVICHARRLGGDFKRMMRSLRRAQ